MRVLRLTSSLVLRLAKCSSSLADFHFKGSAPPAILSHGPMLKAVAKLRPQQGNEGFARTKVELKAIAALVKKLQQRANGDATWAAKKTAAAAGA
ncbi:hypothetical protein LTR17_003353 [Elasticomyces elasticus]|nr:hypothetical protein LTR17_003353 [Elasticomyces elasticus]